MIAKEITTTDLLPLRPDDNCAQAMTMMSIYHVSDLPVVENNELLGIISEDQVSSTDLDTKISSFRLSQSYIFVTVDEHIFEILGKMAQNNMTIMPVVNHDNKYVGMITQEDLIKFYADTFSFKEPGSIIVIQSTKSEYSLSEITRVLEMEGASILASFVTSMTNSPNILVTLKLNRLEISKLLSSLERYDYRIHATFSEDQYESDLKSRYDLLMTYLNV